MRPRAGTHPVTLEPPHVVELLALARRHDELMKEARQDLFRAETKLNFERTWRWPIRAACVALGAVGLAAWQNDSIREGVADWFAGYFTQMRESGIEMMVSILLAAIVILSLAFLIQRWLKGPTPEKQARKLMEDFAKTNGVAAYVFAGQDNPDEEAAVIGALTRPENKHFRKRRLTHDNRPLASSMTRILNQQIDSVGERRPAPPVQRLHITRDGSA